MVRYVFALWTLLVMAGCSQPKTVDMKKNSPDGKTAIHIAGKKQAALDPYTVTLAVKSGDIPEGSLTFEIAADEINDNNTRIDWSDPQHAVITFTQRDGETKIFSLSVSETGVIVAPVSN